MHKDYSPRVKKTREVVHNRGMNIVFDLGGTNLRVAESLEDGGIGDVKKIKTPHDPDETVAELIRLAKEVAGATRIYRIVGGVAGVVKDGVVIWEPNLPGAWENMPLGQRLEDALGAKPTIFNDTAMVGLGESLKGAGRGSEIMAYVTVSTGVGGARILHGNIDESTYGFEIGHQIVNGRELEAWVSGTAVKKYYGLDPWMLEDIDARNELADILATGLYNSVLHWSPDTIVLGGSMIVGKNPIPIERVEATLKKLLVMYPKAPLIKMAELKDEGGLYGASGFIQRAFGGAA